MKVGTRHEALRRGSGQATVTSSRSEFQMFQTFKPFKAFGENERDTKLVMR